MNEISDVMKETMSKIKEMVDVNTIVGNPITTPDGVTLIPVSKVTFGFAAGGSDGKAKETGKPPVRFGGLHRPHRRKCPAFVCRSPGQHGGGQDHRPGAPGGG